MLITASPAVAADGLAPKGATVGIGPLEMRIPPPATPATYRHAPPPRYPTAARAQGLEGVVVLSVLVRRDGRVDEAHVAVSSGATLLDEAALAAVQTWRFEPARRGGFPVESVVEVPLKFALRRP